jgi:capsid assembly protease
VLVKRDLLLAEVRRMSWALEPGYARTMFQVLDRWQLGEATPAETMATARATRDARETRKAQGSVTGGIAVLPLYGVIVQRAGMMTDYSGGTSTQQFSAMLREALADDAVSQVLIDIDSPGGSVFGVAELAAEIMQGRTQKPIIAIANATAASAAYWLGACASELYVTPSGEVGSIGVWMAHEDISAAMEDAGVKTTLISAGKYKTEGNPLGPLGDEAKGFMQDRTNEYYRSFTAAVARGRGVPVAQARDGMGQGRMLGAAAAMSEKMVDGIADFSQVVALMKGRISNRSQGGRARLSAASAANRLVLAELGGDVPAKAPALAVARARRELRLLE